MSGGSELRIENCMKLMFVKVARTDIHVYEKYTDVRSILYSARYNTTPSRIEMIFYCKEYLWEYYIYGEFILLIVRKESVKNEAWCESRTYASVLNSENDPEK